MASPDTSKVYRVQGRIAIGATNFATAFPHGGTALGDSVGYALDLGYEYVRVPAEEFGGSSEIILMERDVEFAVVMRNVWDTDWLSNMFPDHVSQSGGDVVRMGTGISGRTLSGSTVKISFSPNDEDTHPGFIIYQAVPMVAIRGEPVQFSAQDEMVTACRFVGLLDTSRSPDLSGEWGLVEDLNV